MPNNTVAEKKKVKSFTLSPAVLELIKAKAKDEQRSESQIVNMMLKETLR